MKKILNISNLYILLWSLYTLQGVLLPVGSLLSQSIFVVVMLISLYYAYKFHQTYKITSYFKAVGLLLVMFIVYGGVLILYGQTQYGIAYLQQVMISFLPLYPFYIFAKKELITKKSLFIWLFVFVIAITFKYFNLQQRILVEQGWEETVNNTAYIYVAILPLICLFDDKKGIQYMLWAYCAFFIMSSFKRGAMLTSAICFVIFMFYSLKTAKTGQKLLVIVVSVIVVVVGYHYIMELMATSDLFNRKLDATMEGDSSGRDSLFATFWNILTTQDKPLRFLFGYGANGTFSLGGQAAHNDWLELAIDQGLLGLVIYLYYWICSLQKWRSIRKLSMVDANIAFVFGMTVFVSFIKTFFSQGFLNSPFYVSLIIGYCLAQYDIQEQDIIFIQNTNKSVDVS